MKDTLSPVLLVLALLSLVTACATPLEATTDFDQQFDFSKVRSVAIQPIDRANLNSVRVSDMQVSRVNEALISELERKGITVVADNANADLLLTWHLVTDERVDVRSYNSMSYYNCWRCGPSVSDISVREYTQGTFIVDMIDPARNQSVWRAIIESRLKSSHDKEGAAERRAEAANVVLMRFPPL